MVHDQEEERRRRRQARGAVRQVVEGDHGGGARGRRGHGDEPRASARGTKGQRRQHAQRQYPARHRQGYGCWRGRRDLRADHLRGLRPRRGRRVCGRTSEVLIRHARAGGNPRIAEGVGVRAVAVPPWRCHPSRLCICLPCPEDGIVGKGRFTVRWFEAGVVLAGILAFAALFPFREPLATLPGALLVATLVLFSAPGVLVVRWFFGEYCSGVALAPAAFVTSVGLFALSAVPMLVAESTLDAYLWVCGTIVVAFLLAAIVMTFRPEGEVAEVAGFSVLDRGGIMWAPFALLVTAMAYIARTTAPSVSGDIWIYLSWVREYLGGDRLASVEPFFSSDVVLSRAKINGWLLEQAAVSRVSGVDPIDLVFTYLNPALVVV